MRGGRTMSLAFIDKLRANQLRSAAEDLLDSARMSLTDSLVYLQNKVLASASVEEKGLSNLGALADHFCQRYTRLTRALYLSALTALCCRDLRDHFWHPNQ